MFASFLKQFDTYNDKYGVWVFYIGLVLMIVSRSWFCIDEEMPRYYYLLRWYFLCIGQLLLLIRILLFVRKYPLYVFCCIILCGLIWYSRSLSGWRFIFISSIIIAASRDANIKIILRIYLFAFLIISILAPTMLSIGWTGEIVKHKFGLIGHSWGFSNPNLLAFMMMLLTLLCLHYWVIKNTIVIWIICWVMAIFVWMCTLCMTSCFILLLVPILYYYLKYRPIPVQTLALLPWICLLTSIILSCYYNPSLGETTFESRFSIPALVYQNLGLSLFGQELANVNLGTGQTGTQLICVDNAFMHLVLCDGVIIALLFLIFLSHFLYRVGKMEHPLLVSSVIGITLTGMMENILQDAMINFLLLYYFHQYTPLTKKSSNKVF